MTRSLIILGIRGIPAAHGGFETFAERLAPWMRDRGWTVTVYCQGSASGKREEDEWEGIRRIHLPVKAKGPLGTIEFDVASAADCLKVPGTILTLGYNTGFLSSYLRARRRINLVNMDGLEWKRAKYSVGPRAFLWVNERLAAWSGNALIADHPAIAEHLASRAPRAKTVVIPYGGDRLIDVPTAPLTRFGIEPNRFFSLIARPEPENSVLEIVRAFSRQARGTKLMLLGKYDPAVAYHAAVLEAAGPDVIMPGAIYDRQTVDALRAHSIAYLHGHQVGGTNPSLVEALGAGNAIIAHDNVFNRWVAGKAGLYFASEDQISDQMEQLAGSEELRGELRAAAVARWQEEFTWEMILSKYEALIETWSA
jgi:glycosyltransferase involved in cell wall biosynthesis